jgi:nucleoside-diphosphate-sugar epimerase
MKSDRDNLYAYGPVDESLTETLPHRATGPNGRTRAEIAEALLRAHEAGRIRATIGRSSDFFGPHAHLSTVGDRVFARALEGKPAQVLGNPDVPHTVTYIEDFARALVTLGEREEALGQVWHVPNPESVTIRRDGLRGGWPPSPSAAGTPLGNRVGGAVQSDPACSEGAALSVRATLGRR